MGKVFVENAHPRYRISRRETSATTCSVLQEEGLKFESINVVFIPDSLSQDLNRRYLAHDDPTDVLSFRLDEGSPLEGEVYINLDRARVQAREHGVSFKNEVDRLVIHGLLHLLGYDDTTITSKLEMKRKEENYLEEYLK